MVGRNRGSILLLLAVILLAVSIGAGAGFAKGKEKPAEPPPEGVTLPEDVSKTFQVEAGKVKEKLAKEARSLFKREPLGFDQNTLERASTWVLGLPVRVPAFIGRLYRHVRVLGVIGSLIILAFLGIVFYSLVGWKRVLRFLEERAQPWREHLSEAYYPLILSGLRIVAATLIPLLLFGLYSLIQALIDYQEAWFILTGSLLKLWALGALVIMGVREVLLAGHFPIPEDNARRVYRVARIIILYILFSMALVSGAKILQVPKDILALLKFIISLTIILASLVLLLRKQAILGIIPELPYKTYQVFYKGLKRLYYPALFLTFLTGLLWCVGYKKFTVFLWQKTWAVAGAFLVIMLIFHKVRLVLHGWIQKKEPEDHLAVSVHKSFYYLLIFVTVVITLFVILRLLGLYHPLRSVISFPLVFIGAKPVSLWTLIKVILVLLGFIFGSRLLRAYLDYKIYPLLGVDEGLAYSVNTLLSYLFIAIGGLVALSVIGLDIRTLMVFAGAVGIGIGLGLQKIAANLISGLVIIFGRIVRKGDWIEVQGTLGYVRHIGLGATTLWTRDNIEHIIPNGDIIAGTIVNYTMTSPEIRVHIPVGVSYNANPAQVTEILLAAAKRNENLVKNRKPRVWFTEYGDSSINFELLVWIDVRKMSEKAVRSQLYYDIFESFAQAGIEIPFPQRDIHIRSGPPSTSPAGEPHEVQ
jgi:small-conductance mechanosensitive channel